MENNTQNKWPEEVLESLWLGVIGVDLNGIVTLFNQSAEEITGLSRKRAMGKAVKDVFKADIWLADILKQSCESGKIFTNLEESFKRTLEGPTKVIVTTSRIFNTKGELTGATAIIRDIRGVTPLTEEENRLKRLAHIGTFAASLAHEIKNPLSGIKGAAELLRRRSTDESVAEFTDIIVKSSDRLNSIVREMLDFARPTRLKLSATNIHQVLDEVISLAEKGHKTHLNVIKAYDPSLPPVSGDHNRLVQVFLNLINNSSEAINEDTEAKITITTRLATGLNIKSPSKSGANRFITVEVADNGIGIEAGELENIFTPFFTTKSGGSGLGMAISFRIIKEHGGLLSVTSEKGKGTKVSATLPVSLTNTAEA